MDWNAELRPDQGPEQQDEPEEQQEEGSSALLVGVGLVAALGGVWLAAKKGWI